MNIQDTNQIPIIAAAPKKQQEATPVIDVKSKAAQSTEYEKAPKKTNKKKKSSKRCNFHGCRKKLKLTDLECRCHDRFCSVHRLPEAHDCSHCFKNFDRDAFAKQVGLGGGEVVKLNRI